MSKIWKSAMVFSGAVVLAVVVASPAAAGCVDPPSLLSQRALMPLPNLQLPMTGSAAFRDRAAVVGGDSDEDAGIVGLWQFVFTSQGNDVAPFNIRDGDPLDAGYAVWHSDQTEIMNSGRDPATSNFCLGAWTKTGNHTYKLNHFALSWDNTRRLCTPQGSAPSCFVGPTNIREQIALDRGGNSYTGTVTIDQYDAQNHFMFRLSGTIAAKRLTAD